MNGLEIGACADAMIVCFDLDRELDCKQICSYTGSAPLTSSWASF